MTAAERLASIDHLEAGELCDRTQAALAALVDTMNHETTLLRSGRLREAGELAASKTQRAQDYVVLARAVQRQSARLKAEAPAALDAVRQNHERLATQMAENLRALAAARVVTQELLEDVAGVAAKPERPAVYGQSGRMASQAPLARGLTVNRAL